MSAESSALRLRPEKLITFATRIPVFAFRRYEDASLSYTGIESHAGPRRYGLYDTVVAREGPE